MNYGRQHPMLVTSFFRRIQLTYARGFALVLLVTVLTHLPLQFNNLSTDDFLIRANIEGSQSLYEKGLILADPHKSLLSGLTDAFHFYSYRSGTLDAYKQYGNLPWWAADEAKMSPYRPISAFTHWLDFQFAADSFQLQVLHSLIYLILYAYCAYRLFWRMSPNTSIAVLATLFLIVDYSHFVNFNWIAARNVFIAGALGCSMLSQFIRWREQRRISSLLLSLLLLLATLLSAESGVGVFGYLFAYLLMVEKTSVPNLLKALAPFVLVVLAWRFFYVQMGFGAEGISLYVDPGSSPLSFLASLATTLPSLLANVILTVDGMAPSLAHELRVWATLGSLLLAALGVWLIAPLLRSHRQVRWMLLGSLLAAIPASALSIGGSRNVLFISIGFFWVLAVWLHDFMANAQSRLAKLFGSGVLMLHLLFPALLAFLLSSTLIPVVFRGDQQFESVAQEMRQSGGHRALVVVNSRAPNREFYLPFIWQYLHGIVPDKVNLLAPGLSSFYLTRVSHNEFTLQAPAGLPLNSETSVKDVEGNAPNFSEAYYIQILQGLYTAPEHRYRSGEVYRAGDMDITILASTDGRPSKLSIRFAESSDPDEMPWQWFDWELRNYRAMTHLGIGETRFYPGLLDIEKKNIVELCLECE